MTDKMKEAVLIETNYLPSIHYLALISQYEDVVLEKHEFFEKQTPRNRCLVNTSQGVIKLSVPLDGRHGKVLTKDVRVEAGNKWRNTHWRTIESAYRKAPFFEFYSDGLRKILYQGHEFLFDLNLDLLSFCLQSVKMKKQVSATMSYSALAPENIFDARNCISNQNSNNLTELFLPTPYQQVFGNTFVSNLSTIDLLFCCGPASLQIIKSSFKPVKEN